MDDDLAPSKTEGFKVGEKKTLRLVAQYGNACGLHGSVESIHKQIEKNTAIREKV